MQYRIALPSDYDMGIIRRRVRDRGAATDDFGGLALKAYCVSDSARTGQANAYAPFYLWNTSDGMAEFLLGDPFAGILASFGRPAVEHWLGVAFTTGRGINAPPRSATRQVEPVTPSTDLRALRREETARGREAARSPAAHSHAVAVDPATWQLVRFALWTDGVDEHHEHGIERYEVLHLSQPGIAGLG